MMILLRSLLILVLLGAGLAGPASARRLALVIGNDNYQQVSRLEKAGNDAEAMARELERAGFEVSLRRDLGYRRMVVAFEEFYDKVKGGDEVVVFYAGHGVQTERGSYLLPTDIEGETQSQVEKISYSVQNLLEELDRVKARFSLIIVDACRDNPLRSRGRTIGIARGLAAPDVAKGQMVIFSAGRNQKALDSLNAADQNPNGVFTREMLPRMRTRGLSVEKMAIEVKNAVEQLALSVKHEQRPLIVNDSTGDFYFFPPAADGAAVAAAPVTPVAPAPAPVNVAQREDSFWEDAKAADNVQGYQAYLVAYPEGRYALLAKAHITRLAPTQVAQAPSRGAAQDPSKVVSPGAGGAALPASPPPGAASALPPPPTGDRPPPAAPLVQQPPATSPPAGAGGPATPPPASPPATGAKTVARYQLPNGDRYEGEVVANRRTGRGTYLFANGDRYEGEFVDDQFRGRGVMHFANGDRYEGVFQGTTKQGDGVMVFANKDRYEGHFVDNLYDGKGRFTFASGESYVGDYKHGIKHGKGVHVFANKDRYDGEFVNDKPNGKGRFTFASGDVYEGDFVQGARQGQGTYLFANGDRYEGSFENGVFSGRGRLYLANGDRYEGTFQNNLKEGHGTHYFANKDRYEGAFRAGVQHGTGTHYFANGDRYTGDFVRGVRHGKGVHTYASGQTRELEYVDGVEKAR